MQQGNRQQRPGRSCYKRSSTEICRWRKKHKLYPLRGSMARQIKSRFMIYEKATRLTNCPSLDAHLAFDYQTYTASLFLSFFATLPSRRIVREIPG